MSNLEEPQLSVIESSSVAKLAINLIFKLLAALRDTGKLTDEELVHIGRSLIAELQSDHDRFATRRMLERFLPDFHWPEDHAD